MGKNMILKNKEGEQVFPATTADQVSWDKNTNLKQAMAKQDARISNLAKLKDGSTTGDAELQDIELERMVLFMIMLEKQLGNKL